MEYKRVIEGTLHLVDNICNRNRLGGEKGRVGADGCGMKQGKEAGKRSDGEKNNVTHDRHRSTKRLTLFAPTNQLRCHYMTTNTQASPVNVSKCLLYSLEYTCTSNIGEGES